MSILHLHKLFISSPDGWNELARSQPKAARLFVFLVLPLSVVPPLMLEYAGHHVGAVLFPDASAQAWSTAALFFLIAELITVPLMAWAIQSVAHSKGVASEYHDAFTLAAVAAIPLWLSSLALFSGQILLSMGIVVLGMAASIMLIFRGVSNILSVDEHLVAFDIAYLVTALGLVAWVLLIVLGLVPALA